MRFIIFLSLIFSCFIVVPAFAEKGKEVKVKESVSDYQLEPGNKLEINVYREEDLTGIYEIDPSGNLTFPLIGAIKTSGLSIEQFQAGLVEKLKKYLIDPQLSISRAQGSVRSISVLGHVKTPGIYDYVPGSTLMRLISAAGGFAESANKRKIKVIRIINETKNVIVVNGVDIIDGKTDDPTIEPGDIIFVPESIF